MKRNIRQIMKLTTVAVAALGLGLLGAPMTAHPHSWHTNWMPQSVKVKHVSTTVKSGFAYKWPQGAYKDHHFRFRLEQFFDKPHVEFVEPKPAPASYQPDNPPKVNLKVAPYLPPGPIWSDVEWWRTGPSQSMCDTSPIATKWVWSAYDNNGTKIGIADEKTNDKMKKGFPGGGYLKLECHPPQEGPVYGGPHIVHVYVDLVLEPEKVALEWGQWQGKWTGLAGKCATFCPWEGFPVAVPSTTPGLYRVRARALVFGAPWTAWREFCIGGGVHCLKISYGQPGPFVPYSPGQKK
jgi:hypothetical protein